MRWSELPSVVSAGLCLVALGGCGRAPEAPAEPRDPRPLAVERPAAAGPLLVFFGDSLTAGLGLAPDEAFPAEVGRRLESAGCPVRVVNAGVSGETTAGGVRRLDWVLGQEPDLFVVELGANDGLRGFPVSETENNLRRILTTARATGARVVLVGMRIPTSYGPEYTEEFASMFGRLAAELDVELVADFLAGVGGVPELNQADGIHPTAAGHRRLAENLLPTLLMSCRSLAPTPLP